MPGIWRDNCSEIYFVAEQSRQLEDAVKRGMLELIIPPIYQKFKEMVQVVWPSEVREGHDDYVLDYTHANIAIRSKKYKQFFADVRLHFDAIPCTLTLEMSNNEHRSLRIGKRTVGYPLQYQTKHISLADPECHLKAIELISDNIIQLTKDLQ